MQGGLCAWAGRVIAGLRKLNIFPRLLLVFCVLLLFSTLLITLLNQRYFAREIESTSMDYLSLMVQNAAYRLQQEAGRLEDGMALFTQDEQLLAAVEQNGELAAAGGQRSAQFLQNSACIEQGLLRVKEKLGGVKALMLIAGGEQYRMAASRATGAGRFSPIWRPFMKAISTAEPWRQRDTPSGRIPRASPPV